MTSSREAFPEWGGAGIRNRATNPRRVSIQVPKSISRAVGKPDMTVVIKISKKPGCRKWLRFLQNLTFALKPPGFLWFPAVLWSPRNTWNRRFFEADIYIYIYIYICFPQTPPHPQRFLFVFENFQKHPDPEFLRFGWVLSQNIRTGGY